MNRREWLQRLATSLGGTASVPALLSLLEGCAAQPKAVAPDAQAATMTTDPWEPQFFDAAQAAIVAQVVQVLIPRTDTPGAIEAGVPAFIDRVLKDVYPQSDQDRYRRGLAEFDAASRTAYGNGFADIAQAQREALVREVHGAAFAEEIADEKRPAVQIFMRKTTDLAALGFFTSLPGATQVLQFVAIPGKFEACIPLTQAGNGKTWAE